MQNDFVYCDDDPRKPETKYWRMARWRKKEFISSEEAFQLIIIYGWSLRVIKGQA